MVLGLKAKSIWSQVQTCTWPSWCHCHLLSLASVKSRLVLPFWYWLNQVVLDKGPLNGCVCTMHSIRCGLLFCYWCSMDRLCVCWPQTWTVQKWLNWLRRRLRHRIGWAQEAINCGGLDPSRAGGNSAGISRPVMNCQEYLACDRYFQPYSVGGRSDMAFHC